MPLEKCLTKLSQSEYPLSVIQTRPLPEGVNPTKLELYLSEKDFELALGMDRKEFNDLPSWKQIELKKERGLF